MKLLDLYLQNVKRLLPRAQGQDIIAELAEDIRSQIEEREASLGRPLNEGEVEAILARLGHPMMVAERYLPQRYLIGPALLPIYTFVLKMVGLFYLLPWMLVWICFVSFSPAYRAEHPGFALIGTLWSLWLIAVHVFAITTTIFALVERSQGRFRTLGKWNPRELLRERDPDRIPRSTSIGELVGGLVFILWWVDVLRFPPIQGVTIALAPIWHTLYWPILLLYAASAALSIVNAIEARWTRRRAGMRLAINVYGIVLACCLLAAGRWIDVTIPNFATVAGAEVTWWIDLSMSICFISAVVIYAIKGVQDVLRILGKPTFDNWVTRNLSGH